jgi:hypothetical protein
VAQFGFSPSPGVGVRRCFVFKGLIFKYLPLTPALSPFGGERGSNADCATTKKKRFDLVGFGRIYLDFREFIGF